MITNLPNYASNIGRLILIVFPIIFAINVIKSVTLESQMPNTWKSEYMNTPGFVQAVEENCSSIMFMNVTLSVLLAALWNAEKVIKIGAL